MVQAVEYFKLLDGPQYSNFGETVYRATSEEIPLSTKIFKENTSAGLPFSISMSPSYSVHNNLSLFKHKIGIAAAKIPTLMRELDATHIAVTGKSGISAAFAMSMLIDISIITVRKDGDRSHGQKIECSDNKPIKRYIILDDCVDSGETIRRVEASIQMGARSSRRIPPMLVGVFCYNQQMPSLSANVDGRNIRIYT